MEEQLKLDIADTASMEPSMKYNPLQEYVPKERRLVVDWPGLISIAGDRGYFPGCRMVRFTDGVAPDGLSEEDRERLREQLKPLNDGWASAADQLNVLCQWRGNLSIVDWRIEGNSIWCVITLQLEAQQLEDFQEAGRILEIEMRRLKQERAEAGAKDQAKVQEEKGNDAMFLALGKKAHEHNLLGKLRELEEENAKLKGEKKELSAVITKFEKAGPKKGK
jgi:hypothetical protein